MCRFLFPILFLIQFGCVYGQNVDRQLQNILEERQLMGISAVAVYGDSVIYSGNAGFADYARNIPITDSTIFRVASVSKTVTATAFMMLYEKGLFSLDEDISDILGFKVRNPKYPLIPVTPRMLLSHTSGIQDGAGSWNFIMDSYKKNPSPRLQSLLADTGSYYTEDVFGNHKPGAYFNYCNLNFAVIGTMIEKLSGQRFDIFCKQNIFDPLGIKGGYRLQDIGNINNIAVLYRAGNGVWTPQTDNFAGTMPPPKDLSGCEIGSNAAIFSPHGGLRISAGDLAKLVIMQINGGEYKGIRILHASTLALMHKPQWVFDGANGDTYYGLFNAWGLGFQVTSGTAGADKVVPGCSMAGHIGEAYGLVSDMFFSDSAGFGMIYFTNGCKTDFVCGNNSAFFAIDEDMFSALYNLAIAPCLPGSGINLAGNDYKTSLNTNYDNKKINVRFYLPETGKVNCIVLSYTGEKVYDEVYTFNSGGRKMLTIKTDELTPGIYFCICAAEGNMKSFKFKVN